MSLFQELKRRNVVRVGIAYVLMGWVLLQGADFVLDVIGAPDWAIRTLILVVAVGLPIALFFAWAFEVTPEGIKREADVDRSASVAPQTGRKLDRAIMVFLVLVIAIMGLERFLPEKTLDQGSEPLAATAENDADSLDDPAQATSAKSIAVLPFADLSQGQDQGWFADGLAEEVLNSLARVPDLQVSARTASFLYRDSELELAEIARRLGVAHVLEGSVRSSGNRVRVTAQLIRAEDGFHIWSENYDREQADMIEIQEDVAQRIATALETTMDPAELERMSTVGTRSVDAYQAYLRAGALRIQFSSSGDRSLLPAELEQLELARKLDPEFARAHYRVADWWTAQASNWTGSGVTPLSREQMLEHFEEAIALAIKHAASPADRSLYRAEQARVNLRWRQALALYEEYRKARPNENFSSRYSMLDLLYAVGADDSLREELTAMARSGQGDAQQATLYVSMMRSVDLEAAADYAEEAVDRWPMEEAVLYQSHRVLLMAGREEAAASVRTKYLSQFEPIALMELRHACVNGNDEEALGIYQTALESWAVANNSDIRRNPQRRWLALVTLGHQSEADALLRSLDRDMELSELSQLIIYPWFDPRPLPNMMTWMQREGIETKPVAQMPFACTPPAPPSIAVLPFVNMSADPDNEYFSDGVSEEILNVLAAVPELRVAARTSAFAFKGSAQSIGEIAGQLGVDYVLEGSVRKADNQVRITAQLIQADDGFHLWSNTFDRELTNIFDIQDEIAGSIAEVLQVQLLGSPDNFATAQDLSPQAYEKFLKARFLMRQRNQPAMRQAVDLTREVLTEQPDFPRGLIQLAEALANLQNVDAAGVLAEQRKLTNRALSLDPNLAAGYMMRGLIVRNESNQIEAIQNYRRAIEMDPSEPRPYHWLAMVLLDAGHLQQARDTAQKAVDLEPDHANARAVLGVTLEALGDTDAALAEWSATARLGNEQGYWQMISAHVLRDEPEQAQIAADRLMSVMEQTSAPEDVQRTSLLRTALTDPDAIDDYLAFASANPPRPLVAGRELAILGLYQKALRVFIDTGHYRDFSFVWLKDMAQARESPEFHTLLELGNYDDVWDALGPPPACRTMEDGYDCSPGLEP